MNSARLLLLLMIVLAVCGNKKGKKGRKAALEWHAASMPAMNTRLISFNNGQDKELNLDCRVQAHPKASVTWLKDGVHIQGSESIEIKKFNLVLKSVSNDMNGNYTCVVSNKHGQLEWTFHVDVPVKIWPLEIRGPQNITQPLGSSAAFTCTVLNDPNATVRWQRVYKMKTVDDSGPLPAFLPESSVPQVLTLHDIQTDDEGEYRCMAGNVWGLTYKSAWLILQEYTSMPELPDLSAIDKNKAMDNNYNNNVINELDPSEELNPDEKNANGNEVVDDSNMTEYESMDSHEAAGPDVTTKRPKNKKNNRKKDGKKKDRKDKEKNRAEVSSPASHTVTTWTTSAIIATEDVYKTTFPVIWQFGEEENNQEGDTRYKMTEKDQMGDTENTDVSKPADDKQLKGSISSYTIYTIVGAIGGVVLLIGLLAITITVCCKKDEGGIYKSSNV